VRKEHVFTLTEDEVGKALIEWVQLHHGTPKETCVMVVRFEKEGVRIEVRTALNVVCGSPDGDGLFCTLAPNHEGTHAFTSANVSKYIAP